MATDYTTLPLADDIEAKNTAAIQSTFAPKVTYNPLVETARAVGQGATFGNLDELEAALRTGSISSDEYIKLRDQLRGQQKQSIHWLNLTLEKSLMHKNQLREDASMQMSSYLKFQSKP